MSVLTVIQYVCGRTNVPVPATVLGNTDTQIVQMLRLFEEEGNPDRSRLFNARTPNLAILHEKPEHRILSRDLLCGVAGGELGPG